MKRKAFKLTLMAAAVGLASGSVQAVDIRIDGFASAVYGQTLDKDEGSLVDAKYDHEANYQADSIYGIQFRADLTEGLSATAQVLGKGAEDFDAKLAWAYLTYQVNDNFTVKAGRQRLPYFMYSDFLDVGYAYHWVAPPSEVYELGGFDNIDGVNLEYYSDWGPVISRFNVIVGASTTTAGDLDLSSDDHWVISWNMNWDWLTFQATYSESIVTVEGINLVGDGLGETYAEAVSASNPSLGGASFIDFGAAPTLTPQQLDSLDMDNDKGHFAGIGLAADWGTFFAVAEITETGVDNAPLNADKDSWYLSAGFRTGKFTYSLTYG